MDIVSRRWRGDAVGSLSVVSFCVVREVVLLFLSW